MNAQKAQAHPMSWLRTLQRKLYRVAKQSFGRKFGILHEHVCNPQTLEEAWRRVSVKGGAAGVDRQTVAEIKAAGVDGFLAELRHELESGQYLANVIRRVYIPKGKDGKRPLGIPTLKDRVAQMAVKLIIEPLFEADFLDCSLGFRPKRDNKEAAQLVHKYTNTHEWVVDVDLKSYLDTVSYCVPSHGRLSKRVGCGSSTLMRKPLRLPQRTWTADSSPRFTRCKTVCRETPSIRVASSMGTYPGGACSWKRWRSRSSTRMRQGEPGVSCSPTMKPSEIQR